MKIKEKKLIEKKQYDRPVYKSAFAGMNENELKARRVHKDDFRKRTKLYFGVGG